MNLSAAFWIAVVLTLGVTIGSFLNAVIYRLPRNLSLLNPRSSICPSCKHALGAFDLIPLLSFLLLGRCCRYCKAPISWRYFSIELLTGVLFVAIYLRFSQPQDLANCVAMLAFTAVLVPVFFIDLDTFTIPTSLNLLLFFIPLARDLWGIVHHEPGHQLLGGWLPVSLFGALIGALIFGAVRVAGWIWKRVEAMGLGDVLLARGMGAMLVSVIPPGVGALHLLRPFPIWVFLSCLGGIAAYPIIKSSRERKAGRAPKQATNSQASSETEEESSTLVNELKEVAWCLCLGDLYEYILVTSGKLEPPPSVEEDDFVPAPTAIPFGPFLVIGFLGVVFVGEAITTAYLNYALKRD